MKTLKSITGKITGLTMVMIAICIGLTVFLVSSCSKAKEKSNLTVRMTDTAGNFDNVLIDLQGVEVTGSGGTIVTLGTQTGIYNLLDFTNGLNTVIATGGLDAGTISQIRLILGPNNSVMVDSNVFPLSTPSAMQTGLKLQVHQTFEPGVSYSILIDFDANQSIILKGNGEYQLKPVIRTVDFAVSGSIKGSITPAGLNVMVTADLNGTGYSTMANINGDFLIAGLPAGTYSVTLTPESPRQPVTVTGIVVTVGNSTHMGAVAL
jgi:hypothetical protein